MSQNWHCGTYVTLQKSRRCEWCGEWMAKGEKFAYQGKGVFDGEFYDYRMHPECAEVMNNEPYIHTDGFMPYEGERPSSTGETK